MNMQITLITVQNVEKIKLYFRKEKKMKLFYPKLLISWLINVNLFLISTQPKDTGFKAR